MMHEPLFDFDNSYARLPDAFYRRVLPTPVSRPGLIAFNAALAAELGLYLEGVNDAERANIFSGNHIPQGADPIAMAYAGHQFGHFVPLLGDGRAILLGEVINRKGERRDIQLKGCGQTAFSRRGDGRAALGSVVREYIVSEAMHALGIRTTRSLAAITTGEQVYRETPLPGAVLTRIAASHIRIGTFEYFAAQGDYEAVARLADYVIERHYPAVKTAADPYAALLQRVIEAQAMLVASWMHVGFIHGVMNTDNMAVSGETIDYGPCAFMDIYDPLRVFSSIDHHGRYAFSRQPSIAQWNLTRFAETLLPLLSPDKTESVGKAEQLLAIFPELFRKHFLSGMRRKIGLATAADTDMALINELLNLMYSSNADYTLSFRSLCNAATGNDTALQQLFADKAALQAWLKLWHERLGKQPQSPAQCAELMRSANPAYIPRNHRIEEAIEAAVSNNDFSVMQQLMKVLSQPYREQDDFTAYALPPIPSERVYQTFCGT